MSLVLGAAYTGKLASNSVTLPPELPFNSLKELLQRNDYKWGTFRDSSYVTSLKVRECKKGQSGAGWVKITG